ncbi:MAG: hypothetical protein B7Y39_04790 [Bdellovibrio sp. 28-41-41]|nr:MAG: hypothetical protein B7Y39_04790 [Bdellovibrio sp. 28-41-41]
MITLNWMQITIITCTAIYLIIELLTRNEIKDERYQLIELKTQALVSKLTATALVLISTVYIFYPATEGLYLLFFLAMTFLATEILAKQYYKNKL